MKKRSFTIITLVFIMLGGLAGFFLDRVSAEDKGPPPDYRTFSQIMNLVLEHHPDPPEGEEMVYQAIRGMLHTLDPHSNFYDPEMYGALREDQEGSFSGLGMLVTKRATDSPLQVVSPVPDTPAGRAGIQAGDFITHINGENTDELTSEQCVKRLKGPKGTEVTIRVRKPQDDVGTDITLVRDDIPKLSVPYSYLMDDGVGYIKCTRFGQTTPEELEQHMEVLKAQGMTGLILDLRDNPGGMLSAAISVADLFLPPDSLVVYTRGRLERTRLDYFATRDGQYEDLPVVVLVNKFSASASEIIAGVLQDRDRGLVVGDTTWGKGLVQTVFPMEDYQSALALTTARYYTPSGRLIQRKFENGSFDEYYNPIEVAGEDAAQASADDREVFLTLGGREVYGGGGITPDILVKPGLLKGLSLTLSQKRAFFDFALVEIRRDRERQYTSGDLPDKKTLDRFRDMLNEKEITFTEEEFAEHEEFIQHAILRDILLSSSTQAQSAKAFAPLDVVIQSGAKALDDAENLAENVQLDIPDGQPAA